MGDKVAGFGRPSKEHSTARRKTCPAPADKIKTAPGGKAGRGKNAI